MLALQGSFAAHAAALERVGARARLVRDARALASLDALVLPGGESTVQSALLEPRLRDAIADLSRARVPLLGTCAGAILMARAISAPRATGLGLLDIDVRRNAYGRQRESFLAPLACSDGGALQGVFIRAPAITRHGPQVEVLASRNGTPVWVRQGPHMACTFHPELTDDPRVHEELVQAASPG